MFAGSYFSQTAMMSVNILLICGLCLLRMLKKQPALTFSGEVLAQKDSYVSMIFIPDGTFSDRQ